MLVKKTFRAAILLFTITLTGCGYSSYEECLLGEMKGQDASMQDIAEKLCESKHPYERKLYSWHGEWDIGWSKTGHSSITIRVSENNSKYRITRAKMKFSTIDCSSAKSKDFKDELLFTFSSLGSATTSTSSASSFKCMSREAMFGIYDN